MTPLDPTVSTPPRLSDEQIVRIGEILDGKPRSVSDKRLAEIRSLLTADHTTRWRHADVAALVARVDEAEAKVERVRRALDNHTVTVTHESNIDPAGTASVAADAIRRALR